MSIVIKDYKLNGMTALVVDEHIQITIHPETLINELEDLAKGKKHLPIKFTCAKRFQPPKNDKPYTHMAPVTKVYGRDEEFNGVSDPEYKPSTAHLDGGQVNVRSPFGEFDNTDYTKVKWVNNNEAEKL